MNNQKVKKPTRYGHTFTRPKKKERIRSEGENTLYASENLVL